MKTRLQRIASTLFVFLVLNVFSFTATQARALQEEKKEAENRYTRLSHLYLPSLAKKEVAEQKQAEAVAAHNKKLQAENEKKWRMNRFGEMKDMRISGIGNVEALRYVYSNFAKNEKPIIPANSLKENVHHDMELLCGGNRSELERNIFSKIDNTQTKFGRVELQRMIAEPITDVTELTKRQNIIKKLVENEQLFNEIDQQLQQIKSAENNMLWFWKELDEAAEKFFDHSYFKNFLFKRFNDNEIALEAGALQTTFLSPGISLGAPLSYPISFAILAKLISNTPIGQPAEDIRDAVRPHLTLANDPAERESAEIGRDISVFLFANDQSFLTEKIPTALRGAWFLAKRYFDAVFRGRVTIGGQQINDLPLSARLIAAVIPSMLLYFSWYRPSVMSVAAAQEYEKITKEMQKRLIDAGTFVSASQKITHAIFEQSLADDMKNEAQQLASSFSAETAGSNESYLANALLTDTFKGEPTIFCYKGRVQTVFKSMYKFRDHFIDTMKAIGSIDAYMSIAKLYKANANHNNAPYSFAEYIDNATTPYISIENFWHPMIDQNKVVTNSVELGAPGQARNVIITGPNAGGKSTVLKSATLAIILSQTIGIAPARSIKLTPFAMFNTYLNIADTEGKESLFQAEMHRAQDLLHEVRGLRSREFSFVIMDEIFTGTNPKEGMAAAYGIAKKLATYSNSIALIATHFMVLTELDKETEGAFTNKKVRIERDQHGRIEYPYLLENGVADQAIALDLLAQEGFDSEILQDAQNIMNKKADKFETSNFHK